MHRLALGVLLSALTAGSVRAQAPDSTAPGVDWGGRLHAHARLYPGASADGPLSEAILRRARVEATFRPLPGVAFVVEPDFGENEVGLADAFAEAALGRGVSLRAGRFKTPFVRESVGSTSAVWFAERAFPTALSPRRDVGAMVAWEGAWVEASAGVFNGVADGSSERGERDAPKDVAARVTVALPGGVSVGLAGTAGVARGATGALGLSDYETPDERTLFAYADGVVADGRRLRVSPDVAWARGPLAVRAEAALAHHRVRGLAGPTEHTHRAWQIAAAWMLGGSPRVDSAPRVARPVGSGRGALLVAARVHGLRLDERAAALASPDAAIRHATAWAVAVRWYATPLVRVGATVEHIGADGLVAPTTVTAEAALDV